MSLLPTKLTSLSLRSNFFQGKLHHPKAGRKFKNDCISCGVYSGTIIHRVGEKCQEIQVF
jgi:hypothetical protein